MNRINPIPYFIIATFFLLSGCSGKTEPIKEEKIIPVKTLTIVNSTANSERNYVGTVEESLSTSFGFTVPGTVEQVLVSEGQKVQKGQLLASLNSEAVQSAYMSTQASLKQAQDAYDRLSKLYENESLPEMKYVEVETGLQQAKAMASLAQKNLDDCKLYAPHSGVVAERHTEPGNNMMPNETAFKLLVIDKVDIKVAIPENEIGTTHIGETAMVTVTALGNETFTGKVEKKGIAANPLSHTYEIKIGIDNPQSRLMPGMVCKVNILQDSVGEQIVIPNRAVNISHDGKRFVWLVDGNRVKRKFVETGALSNYGVSIKGGLAEGDEIVVEGYQKVSEGMKITVIR